MGEPNKREWFNLFDERQQREIEFDEIYATDFKHGTDGHNARLIIARLAEMIDRIETSGVNIKALYFPKDNN